MIIDKNYDILRTTLKESLPRKESDPGAIQTHDLQNRNLTLYSLSYGAKTLQKYK